MLSTAPHRPGAYGSSTYKSSEIECNGVRWFSKSKGRYVDDMVEWRSDTIELAQGTLLVDPINGRLTDYQSQVRLPASCGLQDGHCVTSQGTWRWNNLAAGMDLCRQHFLRRIEGTELLMQDGDDVKTIFVDDQKLIRLEIKKATWECGRLVHPTNYDQFFVTAVENEEYFAAKALDGGDVDIVAFFKQQAGWVAGELQRTLEEFAQHLLGEMCEQEVSHQHQKFDLLAAQQQAVLAGGAIMINEGSFATPVGEAWKLYNCPAVTVRAVDSSDCHDVLPVQLPHDWKTLLFPSPEGGITPAGISHPAVYMEPHTHILTTKGAKIPCVSQFTQYYKNKEGRWITSMPSIVTVSAPRVLDTRSLEEYTFRLQDADYAHGGVYPPEILKRMQEHILMPRSVGVLVQDVWVDIQSKDNYTHYDSVTNLAGVLHVPDMEQLGLLDRLEHVYDIICDWGYFLSFIVGIYSLLSIAGYVCRLIRRCIYPKRIMSCGERVFHAMIPSFAELMESICQEDHENKPDPKGLPIIRSHRNFDTTRISSATRERLHHSQMAAEEAKELLEEAEANRWKWSAVEVPEAQKDFATLRQKVAQLQRSLDQQQQHTAAVTALNSMSLPSHPPPSRAELEDMTLEEMAKNKREIELTELNLSPSAPPREDSGLSESPPLLFAGERPAVHALNAFSSEEDQEQETDALLGSTRLPADPLSQSDILRHKRRIYQQFKNQKKQAVVVTSLLQEDPSSTRGPLETSSGAAAPSRLKIYLDMSGNSTRPIKPARSTSTAASTGLEFDHYVTVDRTSCENIAELSPP